MHFLTTFIKHSAFWKNTFHYVLYENSTFFKKPNFKKLNQTHPCNSAIWSTSYVSNAYGERYCPGMVIIILFHCFLPFHFISCCFVVLFFFFLGAVCPAWLSSFFFIALLPFHFISCCFVLFFWCSVYLFIVLSEKFVNR